MIQFIWSVSSAYFSYVSKQFGILSRRPCSAWISLGIIFWQLQHWPSNWNIICTNIKAYNNRIWPHILVMWNISKVIEWFQNTTMLQLNWIKYESFLKLQAICK